MATVTRVGVRGRLPAGGRWRRLGGRPPEQLVLAATVTAVAALTAAHIPADVFGDPRLRLNIDEEGSVGVWYSSTQFFAAGAGCWLVALFDTRLRRPWGLLGLMLVAFSAIEVTQVHHPVENAAGVTASVLGWEPLGLAIAAAVLATAARHAGSFARLCLLGAIACLALSLLCSIGYNVFDPPSWIVNVLGVLEEIFEMLVGAFGLTAAVSELAPRFRLERA